MSADLGARRLNKTIVCLWLPDWPITVWRRACPNPPPPEVPFALIERGGGLGARGLCLRAVNGAGRALGLRWGQSQADVRAVVPDLMTAPADVASETRALTQLALWCERFSPCVAMETGTPGMEGLVLDMTGAAHLFGGEAALLNTLEQRLAKANIPARAALADTLGAAWALARFGGPDRLVPPGCARQMLSDLPVEALRLAPEAVVLLKRFGLGTIGDLYPLPRAGLARRFTGSKLASGGLGLRVVERLDQALGFRSEPVSPVRAPPAYRVFQGFVEPVTETAGLDYCLPDLVAALSGQLIRDGQGARRLVVTAYRVDGGLSQIEAGLSAASADPAHMLRLFKHKGLQHLDLGFGIDALMLTAPVAEPLGVMQARLDGSDEDQPDQTALAGLIDRLQARLGAGAVQTPRPRGSWLPERSEHWAAPVLDGVSGALGPAFAVPDRARPILMFHPPEPIEAIAEMPDSAPARFVWRRIQRRVVRAQGPERLGPEWWRQSAEPDPRPARTRDYYRVEDEAGRRYWLFREGLYGREDHDRLPRWWLHGVFA
jgi:protein ImuB